MVIISLTEFIFGIGNETTLIRCVKFTQDFSLKWVNNGKKMAEHFVSASCCLSWCASCVNFLMKKWPANLSPSQRWLTWCPVVMGLSWRWTESQVGGGVCALCWWPGVWVFFIGTKAPSARPPGDVLWSQNYGSPVVGVYLYSGDSLRHAPHLSLAMETLRFLTFSAANEQADTHSTLKWSYQFVKEQATAQTQLV